MIIILKKRTFTFIIFMLLLLGGCSGYKESFAKEPGKGSGWKSMSETYDFNEKSMKNNLKTGKSTVTPVSLSESQGECSMGEGALSNRFMMRRPEKTLRIWFAPFEDTHHNLYEASYVQTIVQSGHWVPICQNGDA